MEVYKYQSTVHDYLVIEKDIGDDGVNVLLDRKSGIGADFLIVLSKCSSFDCEVRIYDKNGISFDNGALLVVGHILNKKLNGGSHFIVNCNNEGYELFVSDNIVTLMRQCPLIVKRCYYAKDNRYVYKIENKNYVLDNEKKDDVISIKLDGNNKFELLGDNITSSDYLNAYVLLKQKGVYKGTCYSDSMLFYSAFLHNIFITSKVNKVYEGVFEVK